MADEILNKKQADDRIRNSTGTGISDEMQFGADATDEQLVDTVDAWVRESESYHSTLLKAQRECLKYYLGDQTDKGEIARFNSNTVHNRIFEGTETLVPIVTGTAHEFIAIPANENEISLKRSQKVQAVLTRKFEDLEMQEKLEDLTRDMILKRFGVLEWFWDKEVDDVGVRVVDPMLIMIPKLRVVADELPYVIKILEFTADEMEENFPDADVSELTKGKPINTGSTKQEPDRLFQVFEVWTDEYVVWKHNDDILKRRENPYWDFKGEQEGEDSLKFFNHLVRPSKPFVFFAPFRTGEAPIASTSICETAIPIQDDINVQKRQIINNLVKMGNGQVYIDKGAIEDEMISQITNEPGLQIVGDSVASENRVRREPGVPIPAAHFSNLQDSIGAFDNIFGVHPSTRGSAESRTLGGQIMNRQQDLTRIDTLTRVLNRGTARVADGLVQLMKMFYTERQVVRILGPNDAVEFLNFSRGDIEDGVVINVKSGPVFPEDPTQRANRAIQLWQLGALDPTTLYKHVGFPNPEETAQKLLAWKQGQLLQETNARIAEAQAGAQAKAAAAPQGRGVETSTSNLGRKEQEVSNTAPAQLPKTPKTENSS